MVTIIAECCQNHNGDLEILKDMIWAAADSGADIVKIQSIRSKELTSRERFEQGLEDGGVVKAIKRPYQAELQRLGSMDLDADAHQWFVEECAKANIRPMTTAFTTAVAHFLATLPWQEIKVASYDCGSYPMIMALKENFNHLYISTGASFDEEIKTTSDILRNHSFTYLHCVTIYPTPLQVVNLARIDWLRQFTPSVGYSDHSLVARDGLKASIAAIFHGADVIERHFTVLAPDKTKDGPVSINPKQLSELVKYAHCEKTELTDYVQKEIPEYEMMKGQAQRNLTPAELLNRDYYRGRFASKVKEQVINNWEELEA